MLYFLKVPNQSIEPSAVLIVSSTKGVSYQEVLARLSLQHPDTVAFSLLENAAFQAGPVASIIAKNINSQEYETADLSKLMYSVLSQKSINPYYVCVDVPLELSVATVEIFNVRRIDQIITIADLSARASEVIAVAPSVPSTIN